MEIHYKGVLEMAFMRFGSRKEWEDGIRKLFCLPAVIICPLLGAGLLRGVTPALLSFIIGGAVGGAFAYIFSEGLIQLLRRIWPPKQQ